MLAASDRFFEVLQERVASAGGAISLTFSMPGRETMTAERLRDLHDVDDAPAGTEASGNRRTG
jgi:hypothetical protein